MAKVSPTKSIANLVFGVNERALHIVATPRSREEPKKLLESLPFWYWNPFEERWNEGFNYLKQYIKEYGYSKVSQNQKYKNFNLGMWVSHQRKNKNNLELEKIKLLESLPEWSWSIFEEQWNEGFCYLQKYIEENGNTKVPHRLKCNNFSLGTWVSSQKSNYKKNKLDLEKIKKLESLLGWVWGEKKEK